MVPHPPSRVAGDGVKVRRATPGARCARAPRTFRKCSVDARSDGRTRAALRLICRGEEEERRDGRADLGAPRGPTIRMCSLDGRRGGQFRPPSCDCGVSLIYSLVVSEKKRKFRGKGKGKVSLS